MFKTGDIILRVGNSWNNVRRNGIYKVVRCGDGSLQLETLKNISVFGSYESRKFILYGTPVLENLNENVLP